MRRAEERHVGKKCRVGSSSCASLDTDLTGTTLHLLSRNLGTSTTGADRLGLVGLAQLGLGLLVLLALGNGGLASGSTHLGLLVSASVDLLERSTNDTTLVLDSLARALLGNFLGDTLLVESAVDDSPGNLTGVLALQEQRLVLGADKAEDLVVTTDVETTLTTVAGQGVRMMVCGCIVGQYSVKGGRSVKAITGCSKLVSIEHEWTCRNHALMMTMAVSTFPQ